LAEPEPSGVWAPPGCRSIIIHRQISLTEDLGITLPL
jgi:hypothetical protein